MKRMVFLTLIVAAGMSVLPGCFVGSADVVKFDLHASVMRGFSNTLATLPQSEWADPNSQYKIRVIAENEARAAENFAAGLHSEAPKWITPATQPSDLPK